MEEEPSESAPETAPRCLLDFYRFDLQNVAAILGSCDLGHNLSLIHI